MITLLKTGYWKILQLFYANKSFKLHFREIARKTKLHEPSATRFLQKIEEEGLLKSQKDGNLKKFFIKKNKRTYLIFALFDIERFERLPDLRKKAIHYYFDKLREKPVFVILFGSTAKETYTKDSDIDILIVTNRHIETKEAEKETDALTSMRISTFQIEYGEFLRELKLRQDPLVQSALNSGYPLINHIFYYEVIHNERL